MKKLYTLLLIIASVIPFNTFAQTVTLPQATISPAPMATLENNGVAIGGLDFAETSGIVVPAEVVNLPNVTISINFQFVELSDADVDQITGSLLDFFAPSYNANSNTLVFSQTNDIPGDWSGTVNFPMDVIQNSTQGESFNGFNANIAAIGPNTNAEGNAAIFTYTDESVLNIETLDALRTKVIPNPTKGILNIDINNNFATGVEVYDLMGRVVLRANYNGNSNTISLDISHLSAATYVLKVSSNDATYSTRIIKE